MTAPVRVLAVVKGLGAGGAEQLLVSMAVAADPERVTYEVAYLLPHKDRLVPAFAAAGVPTHCVGTGPGVVDARWVGRLVRLTRRGSFDVVHLHSPAVAAVARPALRAATPAAVVSTEHNEWASHAVPTRILNGLTLGLSQWTIAVSDAVRDSVWPRLRPRVEVVVHGIPYDALRARVAERAAARAELGVADDEVLVVAIANVRPTKDHPTMLRAARIALDGEPRLRFVNLGVPGPGDHPTQVSALWSDLGLGDRFRFAGFHADPPRVLAAADMFTLSSVHEGLPVALLEAMAVGVPPVVTAVGGVPRVVRDGIDGVLVPPAVPEALADAWVGLAGDASRRAGLGRRAQERARDFDAAPAARRLEAGYARLVADRG